MKRSCSPSPIVPCSSHAFTVNIRRRPSTATNSASAVISAPTFDALMCELFIIVPTVVEPSGSAPATAFIAAFSISAIIAGVAKTAISPEPRAWAVLPSATTTLL